MLFENGFALGVDGRATTKYGDIRVIANDKSTKLVEIGGVWIAQSGNVERCAELCKELRDFVEIEPEHFYDVFIIKNKAEYWLMGNVNVHRQGIEVLIAGYRDMTPYIYFIQEGREGVRSWDLRDYLSWRAFLVFKGEDERNETNVLYAGDEYRSAAKLPLLYAMGSGAKALYQSAGFYRGRFPDSSISNDVIDFMKTCIARAAMEFESCGGQMAVVLSREKDTTVTRSHCMEVALEKSICEGKLVNSLFFIWKNPNFEQAFNLLQKLQFRLPTGDKKKAETYWLVATHEVALIRVISDANAEEILEKFGPAKKDGKRRWPYRGLDLYVALGSTDVLRRVLDNSFFS